jgi:hypothetical protein
VPFAVQERYLTTLRSLACVSYHVDLGRVKLGAFCYPFLLIGCVIYRAERGKGDPASHSLHS